MAGKVKVPPEVYEGIIAVRDSGRTNMFNIEAVKYWAFHMGYDETMVWLNEHRNEYGRGMIFGFEVEEENSHDEQ